MSDTMRQFEAGAAREAVGSPPNDERGSEAVIKTLAGADRKAARFLAKAEAANREAEAANRLADGEAAREAARRAAKAGAKAEAAATKAAASAAKHERRAAARGKAVAWVGRKLGSVARYVRNELTSAGAGALYLIAVGVAVGAQVDTARQWFLWPLLPALGLGLVIEVMGLVLYATSVQERLKNRSGLAPRLAAWSITGIAAWTQFTAHKDVVVFGTHLLSYILAIVTIGAMVIAEIRTNAAVADRLEKQGQKVKPFAHLGGKFIFRYPRLTWYAWSAMILDDGKARTRADAIAEALRIQEAKAKQDLIVGARQMAEQALRRTLRPSLFGRRGSADVAEAVRAQLQEYIQTSLKALEAELASVASLAPAVVIEAEAELGERREAEAGSASIDQSGSGGSHRTLPRRRPTPALPSASTPAHETEAATEADNEAGEAAADEPTDLVWAGRPGGLNDWAYRLSELASAFPGGAEAIPGRDTVKRVMAERSETTEFAWTSNRDVDWARGDLKANRRAGRPDPAPRPVSATPEDGR